ncbi:sugar nucleotide-binding protein [Pontimonas sp.]|nr:sugar nucleotide-binding protein [Pontimonas sp.]
MEGPLISEPLKVMLLGSNGFLGSGLAFHMSTDDSLSLARVSTSGGAPIQIESYSYSAVARVVDLLEPDIVINCVGVVGHKEVESDPLSADKVNVQFPKILAQLTRLRDITLLHFSTDSVYSGIPEEAPFSESSPTQPFSLYGVQKLASEAAVLDENPRAVVMRINFFGWSQSGAKGILDHFISHAISGTQPVGFSDYFATSLYVGELSRAVVAASRADISGVFNVGSPDSHSKLRFGQEVFFQLGLDAKQVIRGNPSIWGVEGVTSRDLSMSSQLITSTLDIAFLTQLQGIDLALNDAREFLCFLRGSGHEVRLKALEGFGR